MTTEFAGLSWHQPARMTMAALVTLGFAGLQAAPTAVQAATINIINNDPPGEGFNDLTPVDPVGGNPGTTLGEQRLNVFKAAAMVWEDILVSSVPIEVLATFRPLACSETGAVLGSAGPENGYVKIFSGEELFPSFPRGDTIYVSALANSFVGEDIDPDEPDIVTSFNSDFGQPGCLEQFTFSLAIDGSSTPGNAIALYEVVVHELAHGLGFLTFIDKETGEMPFGFNDAYMSNLADSDTDLGWPAMTAGERAVSAVSDDGLIWHGNAVTDCARRRASQGTNGRARVLMYAPEELAQGSSVSHFDLSIAPNDVMEPSVAVGTPLANIDLSVSVLADIGWQINDLDTNCTSRRNLKRIAQQNARKMSEFAGIE